MIQENISLRDKTSYHIGGVARFYIGVQSAGEICEAVQWAGEKGVDCRVIGGGSNLLVSDSGWDGLVIDTSGITGLTWQGNELECACGELFGKVVRESVDRGFAGMEECAGIPGTIGGALFMNAGAFSQTVSDLLLFVEGIDTKTFLPWKENKENLSFGYRSSSFQSMGIIVTRARFCFKTAKTEPPILRYQEILNQRIRKQPLDKPNCGSVFKRPKGFFAGTLIEECGLKGFSAGKAMISPKHANFIVNMGDATAEDVRICIYTAQRSVFEKCGILLEPEVIFIGKFETPLFSP